MKDVQVQDDMVCSRGSDLWWCCVLPSDVFFFKVLVWYDWDIFCPSFSLFLSVCPSVRFAAFSPFLSHSILLKREIRIDWETTHADCMSDVCFIRLLVFFCDVLRVWHSCCVAPIKKIGVFGMLKNSSLLWTIPSNLCFFFHGGEIYTMHVFLMPVSLGVLCRVRCTWCTW